ncbi:hypothetical protein PCASD_12444 [Puccinia coronata f. sp. avenae]|uniref:Mediator of RNA polymerase II transcription subunit 4 n=1 Tax=Puccinia coronata f. sp. avenae TaxID=200324 RepID=A0A2N5U039_9BASI|nr:hypothetical protein PCASD_12444 [Puccinia coronata f. sp. avenae]
MNQELLGPLSTPNDHQPLTEQFELFLNHFNRITQAVFTQIASSSLSTLSSTSTTTTTTTTTGSHEIQNLYLTLSNLNSNHFKNKLDLIFDLKNQLDRICSDGQNEKNHFAKLNDLALTPGHIMSYARLIAPYTSAPPAPTTTDPEQPINLSTGLDLQDPSLRFLMPFPTEDVIRRGRMGQEMSAPVNGTNDALNGGTEIGALLGEIRTADGARPTQTQPNAHMAAYPTMPSRRPPPPPLPESDDDLFDLDLNPDLQ